MHKQNGGEVVVNNGGLVIGHLELETNVGLCWIKDGVHLSDGGLTSSLGLQEGIQRALWVWRCLQE